MVSEFLAWWAEQMAGLVPPRLRAWSAGRGNALVVAVEGGAAEGAAAIDVALRRGRRERRLGRLPLDDMTSRTLRDRLGRGKTPSAVALRLGPTWLLEREVALPIAAEREPARILGYELDRLTPFAASELFWEWAVVQRDRAQGRIHFRLSMVPRAGLQPVLAALDAAGIRPRVLETLTASGSERTIPLDPPDRTRTRLGRAVPAVAVGLTAVLALTALALPFVRQALARGAVENRIEALRPAVAESEALRSRIAGNQAGSDVIAAERARVGDPLRVIATVTEILPDDTFLTELQLRRGRLGLAGQSAAAARLIPALAAEPTFRNPAFVAPVTRVESGGADVFSVAAEVGPAR